MNKKAEFGGFLIGLGAIFFLFMVLTILYMCQQGSSIHKLGNAICDQEYDMQFYLYSNGQLVCKPKEVITNYDGLQVKHLSDEEYLIKETERIKNE